MINRSFPIGVFDSGLGGLSVVKALSFLLPHEDILYLADNKRMPYGNLSPETIIQYTSDAVSFLEKKGAKLIVLACHTSSAHWIRKKSNVQVFGVVESSMNTLAKQKTMHSLVVFGTPGMIASGVYPYELQCKYGDFPVSYVTFQNLASMIESNWLSEEELEKFIEREMHAVDVRRLDTALLACTHYPLIEKSFQKVLGAQVSLLDPAKQIVLDVKDVLEKQNLLRSSGASSSHFYVTETPDLFAKKASRFVGEKVRASLCTF